MNRIEVVPLPGLRADNPLSFMASLGALNLLDAQAQAGEWRPRLSWSPTGQTWHANVHFPVHSNEGYLEKMLSAGIKKVLGMIEAIPSEFANLKLTRDQLRALLLCQTGSFRTESRLVTDLLAGLLCEGTTSRDLALRTQYMFTSGQQRFLGLAAEILAQTDEMHLRRTLYTRWDYDDETSPLRWDPADLRNHAYMSTDPSDKRATPNRMMIGANALAMAGLASLTLVPGRRNARSVGIVHRNRSAAVMRWPTWEAPLQKPEADSLMRHPGLTVGDGTSLQALGVCQVYASVILGETDGYKNFGPAVALLG